jgi:hypothetical protein
MPDVELLIDFQEQPRSVSSHKVGPLQDPRPQRRRFEIDQDANV